MEERVPFTPRATRAAVLIGVALAALVASGVAYLRPGVSQPRAAEAGAASAPAAQRPTFSFMHWTSPEAGWLSLYDAGRGRSTLLRTADGGRHWRAQRTDAGVQILGFADARQLVLGTRAPVPGAPYRVFRTTDGGADWLVVPLPADLGPLSDFPVFVDGTHGWILSRSHVGQDAQLLRTRDGGAHWQLLVTTGGHPLSQGLSEHTDKLWVSFEDPLNGWIGGREPDGSPSLSVTHDGGVGWTRVVLPAPPGGWVENSLATISPPRIIRARGVLVVSDYPRVGSVPFSEWVLTTEDGGVSWSGPTGLPMAGTLPNGLDYFFLETAPLFADGRAGWRVSGVQAWTTADAGRTWASAGALPAGWSFGSVFPLDATTAWAEAPKVGAVESYAPWRLFVTHDGGRHWASVSVPALTGAGPGAAP